MPPPMRRLWRGATTGEEAFPARLGLPAVADQARHGCRLPIPRFSLPPRASPIDGEAPSRINNFERHQPPGRRRLARAACREAELGLDA